MKKLLILSFLILLQGCGVKEVDEIPIASKAFLSQGINSDTNNTGRSKPTRLEHSLNFHDFEHALADSYTTYKIFSPQDIPAPIPNSQVKALYNTSVTFSKTQGYIMVFGVSIYCQNGTVARDSIASATSQDGINFKFKDYILTPDARACSLPIAQWGNNFNHQVNDPTSVLLQAHNGKEYLYVMYTAAEYKGCGKTDKANIGMAIFDAATLSLIYRNNHYLEPSTTFCNANKGYGFSRPSYSDGELWFDTIHGVYKIPVSNINQLDPKDVISSGMKPWDNDIGILNIKDYTIALVRGANGLQWTGSSRQQASWSNFKQLTTLSGQTWDSDMQAAGEFFIEKNKCRTAIYLSGIDYTDDRKAYKSINIGVSIPKENRLGKLICGLK